MKEKKKKDSYFYFLNFLLIFHFFDFYVFGKKNNQIGNTE